MSEPIQKHSVTMPPRRRVGSPRPQRSLGSVRICRRGARRLALDPDLINALHAITALPTHAHPRPDQRNRRTIYGMFTPVSAPNV
jgi:hypothetical protein